MSTATASAEVKNIKQSENNLISVYGKITVFRKEKRHQTKENFYVTVLTLPSSGDEFGYPPSVEVTSQESLGVVGDVVTVKCKLSGMSRTFERTDGEGVITKARGAFNHLIAL